MRYFIKLKDLGNKIDFFDEQLSVIDEKITYLEEAKGKVIWQSDAANEFYNYYDNLYQVGVELQNEVEKRLFSEYDNLSTASGVEKYIDELFIFLEGQENIYRELLSSNASVDFLRQLESSINERVLMVLKKNGIKDKNVETELLFTTNGAIAIIRKYYRGEIDLTLDDIRDHLKAKIGLMFSNADV